MSRSYKRTPCCDRIMRHTKYKKIFNRRIRRKRDLDLPSGGRYRRMCESWDICDFDGRVLMSYERWCEWNEIDADDKASKREFHTRFLDK